MSTAGKVLVFLTLPLIVVWIVLMSAVAHYNRQGTKAVLASQQEQAKIENDIKKAKADVAALKDDLNIVQVETSRALAVIQDKKYAVQKQLSDATNAASSVAYALEDQQKALKAADLNRDHRIAENKQVQAELTAGEEEVERLKQVDQEQRVRLKNLRDEFAKVYKANKLKVISQGQ